MKAARLLEQAYLSGADDAIIEELYINWMDARDNLRRWREVRNDMFALYIESDKNEFFKQSYILAVRKIHNIMRGE